MSHSLILLRHGQSTWNLLNLFTGWYDADLTDQGEAEAPAAGPGAGRGRGARPTSCTPRVQVRAIRTADLALDEMGRLWLPVRRQLAAERAPLRRPAGQGQEADHRRVRRRAGEDLAPQLRHRPAAARRRRRATPPLRSPLRRPGPRPAAGHRVPRGRRRPHAAVLVRRHRPRPGRRPHRARGRPRQQPAGAGQAPRRHLRRRHRRAQPAHRRARSATSWAPTSRPLEALPIDERYLGDVEAARAAAEAVAQQATGGQASRTVSPG